MIIRGASAVVRGMGLVDCDIVIDGGKITGLVSPGSATQAQAVFDADGLVAMPGVIDPHVHFGLGSPDDWRTETQAAAKGGVSCVLNYIQSPESYLEVAPLELDKAGRDSVIDFGLHFILMNEMHLSELGGYISHLGVNSFKYFTNFKGDEGAYLGITGTDNGFFYALCERVAQYPEAILAVHTENIELVWRLAGRLKDAGRDDLAAWTESRPDIVEAHDMFSAFLFGERTGARIYIPHLSSGEGLRVYREHQRRGGQSIAETCPHYLTHTSMSELGGLVKVNPPVRGVADAEALWAGLADGTITTSGSDHNSRPRAKKEGSIWTASAGFPGVTTLLPVLLSEGHAKRGLPLEKIAELTSLNPAQTFGLYPQKGAIAIGADADFALVDLNKTVQVDSATFGSHADYSIYDGWQLKGWPIATLVRGDVVMREGEILAERGHGKFLARPVQSRGERAPREAVGV
jgi:dihydropyrimidinase